MIKLYQLIIINEKELSVVALKMDILLCGSASNLLLIVHLKVKVGKGCLASNLKEPQ
jgi:hypothetical protein